MARTTDQKPAAEVFPVKLGGPETGDDLVGRLGFPANSYITENNFPIAGRAETYYVEVEIVDPSHGTYHCDPSDPASGVIFWTSEVGLH